MKQKIPLEILNIIETLQNKGFEAQIVGGSVRDLLLELQPKDWDINTNATPDQILALFPDSFYENDFGTVGVKIRNVIRETEETEIVEVTPYRKEGIYSDGRRPDTTTFDATLEQDLLRRDFTVNSLALDPIKDIVYYLETLENKEFHINSKSLKDILKDIKDIDSSLKDIKDKILRAVGNPDDRFQEDYLRMLRAVRFSCQLGFNIEEKTLESIKTNSKNISKISKERIRDELIKIINSLSPMVGFLLLDFTGLINEIIPELLLGKGMKQTANHKFDVYGHLLRSMQHAADKNFSFHLRIAALLHDIAKPHTCRLNKDTGWNSFHGHEVVGEKVSRTILERLKFPQELVARVTKLVRWHMFNSDPDQVTMSAVRRMIVNVGSENIWDLMNIRLCDRIGSGRPMEEPFRLRRYYAMIEEAMTQPTSLKMLKINGSKVIEVAHVAPGPKIGLILNALMGEVLEYPDKNSEEFLVSRATILAKLSIEELKPLAEIGKEEIQEVEEDKIKKIERKFKVG